MSCCTPTNSCSSNVPETCEALPTTNAAARLVAEDAANCKKTISAPVNPSVLTQTAGGSAAWSDGSTALPINLPMLKDSTLAQGLVGKNANGDIAELVHTPEETEDEIILCDATGWKKKTASEIFGTATGVAVRVAGGPASWVNGLPGQLLGIAGDGSLAFTNSALAYGTTAQRPVLGAGDRAIYFNTTLQVFEWWNGTFWMTSSATRRSDEIIQTFASSQAFTVPAGITNIAEVLVVGGGGGGGYTYGGGGGGGGVIYQLNYGPVVPGSSITVTVGAGGAARTSALQGGDGGTSAFGSLSAIGGGGGGCGGSSAVGRAGGSGGGGGNTTAGGAGTALQGSSGGNSTTYSGGGGGGAGQAGAAGSDAAAGTGGAGGIGRELSISGVSLFYGGGGGGAGGGVGGAGSGTSGGGGNGGGGGAGLAGTANTGGGGGGGMSTTSGAGGSGIVIIKY